MNYVQVLGHNPQGISVGVIDSIEGNKVNVKNIRTFTSKKQIKCRPDATTTKNNIIALDPYSKSDKKIIDRYNFH